MPGEIPDASWFAEFASPFWTFGPFFLGMFGLIVAIFFRKDKRTCITFLSIGVGASAFAMFVWYQNLTRVESHFFTGTIDWSENTGSLASLNKDIYLSQSFGSAGNIDKYTFYAIKNDRFNESVFFELKHLKTIEAPPDEEDEGGDNPAPQKRHERSLFIRWKSSCGSGYKYEFTADKEWILCKDKPRNETLKEESGDTGNVILNGLIDRLIPKAYAANYNNVSIANVSLKQAANLTSEKSSVGYKIVVLQKLLTLSPKQARELAQTCVQYDIILPLALLDLQRHNDPELASLAKKFLDRINVPESIRQGVAKAGEEPKNVMNLLNALTGSHYNLNNLKTDNIDINSMKILIPTSGSDDRDRYFILAQWQKKSSRCMEGFFSNEKMFSQYKREKMEEGSRKFFMSTRISALKKAKEIEACNASATFVKR